MIGLRLYLDGDGVWTDLPGKRVTHLANDAPPIQIAMLDGGMKTGRPSVALRIDLPDGAVIIAETSARLLVTAAAAIHARYPDLLKDDA